jgi:murein hydrolase activator
MKAAEIKKGMVYLFTFFCVALFGADGMGAEKGATLTDQIQKEKKELEKLKKEIEGKREKNIAVKKREESILSLLEGMDQRLRVRQKEASFLELKIREKDNELERLSGEIKELSGDTHERQKVISKRLRTIYQERQTGSLKILFASQDYSDFLRRFQYLKTIAQKEGEMLSLFKEKKLKLEEKNREITETKQMLVRDREDLAQTLIEIRTEKKRKDQLLSRVRNERVSYERVLAELDESSLQLQVLLKTLEDEKKRLQKRFSEKFSKERGRLGWPNDGDVVALFGRQKHPKFDTFIYRKGIEIEPSKGQDVKTVYDGIVIYANWFRGYGMVIIVDHGENYYSIYAHLSKLLVSVGDAVGRNRTIGEVGETGLSQGNRLYFEIRHQGEPMDPLAWLLKRRLGKPS